MAKASTVIIIILLVIIVLGGAAAFLYIGGFIKLGNQQAAAPAQTSSGGSGGLFIDPNAGEYVAPTAAPQDNKPSVAIPGWGSMTIPAYATDIGVGVDFYNPEKNAGYYYLTFELRLADGEVLYKSGLVEPGKHIQRITTSRGLSPGTYDAVVFVQPYSMDGSLAPTNNANLKTTLIVK